MNNFFFKIHKSLSTTKGMLVAIFLSVIPSIMVCFLFFFKMQTIQLKKQMFKEIYEKAKNTKQMRALKNEIILKHKNSDLDFIPNFLEKMSFKKKEIAQLKQRQNYPSFQPERLNFLEKENKFFFKSIDIFENNFLKETEEKQSHSVEVDKEDIENILSIIENDWVKDKKRPQLIIKNFSLERTKKETFLLNMNLIKREFK